VTWWRKLASSDPLSPGRAKELMLALAAAGDRAGAVKHARVYQELVRQELDIEPDAEVDALASMLSVPVITESEGAARGLTTTVAVSSRPQPALASSVPLPNGAPRIAHSRRGAVLSFAGLVVLLIGVVAIANQRWRNHPRRPAESTIRRASTIALPAARDAYLRALEAWGDGSKAGLDTAVAYFRSATEVDRDYAEAYAGLADAYVMLGYFGYRPREEMFPKAKVAALRSMQLDSTLASAHPALAYELTWERDFAAADSEFRKAVAFDPTYVTTQAMALDPTYAMAHQWYRILLMILGNKPETVVASRPAVKPNAFALNVPVVGLTFTKWFTTYPALTGFTGNGPGTMSGEVLSRIDDGVTTHLVARYEVADPRGAHAFKAVIQGESDDRTGTYEMNGIVTWGWMLGAHVRVMFARVSPCEFGKLSVCFQGTIEIQRR
jgi:tetratricopeptide (TPR) repeat protein